MTLTPEAHAAIEAAQKKVLTIAMGLAGCETLGQFNNLPDPDAKRYFERAAAIIKADPHLSSNEAQRLAAVAITFSKSTDPA